MDRDQAADEIGGHIFAVATGGPRIAKYAAADRAHAMRQIMRAARLDTAQDLQQLRRPQQLYISRTDIRKDVQLQAPFHRVNRARADGFAAARPTVTIVRGFQGQLNEIGRGPETPVFRCVSRHPNPRGHQHYPTSAASTEFERFR